MCERLESVDIGNGLVGVLELLVNSHNLGIADRLARPRGRGDGPEGIHHSALNTV